MKVIKSEVPPVVSQAQLILKGWKFDCKTKTGEIWRKSNQCLLWWRPTNSSLIIWRE